MHSLLRNRLLSFELKKYFYIIIFPLLFTACEYGETFSSEKEQVFYPSEERLNQEKESVKIYLDSVENYAQLYECMEKFACEGKTSIIKFDNNEKSYNILVNVGCPNNGMVVCFMRVNHIHVNSKFVMYDYDIKLPVENLNEALSDLIANPLKYKFQSNSLMDAVIWFHVDEKEPIEVTKQLLIKITGEFEKINREEKDKFPYYINFERRQYERPPPPPPPPVSEEYQN